LTYVHSAFLSYTTPPPAEVIKNVHGMQAISGFHCYHYQYLLLTICAVSWMWMDS